MPVCSARVQLVSQQAQSVNKLLRRAGLRHSVSMPRAAHLQVLLQLLKQRGDRVTASGLLHSKCRWRYWQRRPPLCWLCSAPMTLGGWLRSRRRVLPLVTTPPALLAIPLHSTAQRIIPYVQVGSGGRADFPVTLRRVSP